VQQHGDGREDENPSGLGLGREGLKGGWYTGGRALKTIGSSSMVTMSQKAHRMSASWDEPEILCSI
jgi:hypothetical protein